MLRPHLIYAAFAVVAASCSNGDWRAETSTSGDDDSPGVILRTEITPSGSGYAITNQGAPVARFDVPEVGLIAPIVTISGAGNDWQRVQFEWSIPAVTPYDELAVEFDLALEPDFQWIPHLAPLEGYVASQESFRSPAIIVAEGSTHFAIVPDLDLCGSRENPWFVDYDAVALKCWVGMSLFEKPFHTLYEKVPGMEFEQGTLRLAFFIRAWTHTAPVKNPFGPVREFLWSRFAEPTLTDPSPLEAPLDQFVEHTYGWATDRWDGLVWQEFLEDELMRGGPIVSAFATQSPNYTGGAQPYRAEIWNQAWFSSLKDAGGMLRYARRTSDPALEERAMQAKRLALSAPVDRGFFPTVLQAIERPESGDLVGLPALDWTNGVWTNSNANPEDQGVTRDWYHLPDMSWTALQMLRWHEELEADPALVAFATDYGEALLTVQMPSGFFPSWLEPGTLTPSPLLLDSPESSLSAWFLLRLTDVTGDVRFRDASLNCLEAIQYGPVLAGRWEDFETYWSDNAIGRETMIGTKVERNGIHKQNTLSMFWTAGAMLEAFRMTNHGEYLEWGQRVLDELSMWQQVWNPPFYLVTTVGGFGVMNADSEWNDARQTLVAELFLDYYRETGDEQLFHRGAAALRAGFYMMYAPENPNAATQWEIVYPHFGPTDIGFTMENYAHVLEVNAPGDGFAHFSIFDWGCGSASESWNRIFEHYGDVFIHTARDEAFAIHGIEVSALPAGFELVDTLATPRMLRVMFDDGFVQQVMLDGSVVVQRR